MNQPSGSVSTGNLRPSSGHHGPGAPAGHFPVADHRLAAHEHVADAQRELHGILEGGPVGDACGVEHDEVGAEALRAPGRGRRSRTRPPPATSSCGPLPRGTARPARGRSGRGRADRCRRRAGAAGRPSRPSVQTFTNGRRRNRSTTASSWENETMATPMRSSRSRSKAASNGSLPRTRATSASVFPSHSGCRPEAMSATTIPSGPLHFQKLSQSAGAGSAICVVMRLRASGSPRRASVASVAAVVSPGRQDRAQQRAARDVGVLVGGEAQAGAAALLQAPAPLRPRGASSRAPRPSGGRRARDNPTPARPGSSRPGPRGCGRSRCACGPRGDGSTSARTRPSAISSSVSA